MRGRAVWGGIRGDVADGSDKDADSKSRARRAAQPRDGGLRHDAHGRAADRSADRRRNRKTHRRAEYADGVRVPCAAGKSRVPLSCGHEAAANTGTNYGRSSERVKRTQRMAIVASRGAASI